MLVIPAVDIQGGSCVRLRHGDPGQKTVYSTDPLEMGRQWIAQGARRLHIVDLDAALGTGNNLDLIFKIREALSCEIEMGGGMRRPEAIRRALEKGIDRVVIGTALFKGSAWLADLIREFPGRLMAGVDARDGEVRVEGWRAGSGRPVGDALRLVREMGFQEVIFTDIAKDGTLQGPNIPATRAALKSSGLGVYASGGVTTLEDIRNLKTLEPEGLRGCIVGKALYDGQVGLADAIALAT